MTLSPETACDLVVVGSGAGGLATAVTAAWLGLDVIVIEKEHQLGGTTAWSGGWMWVPRNPLAVGAGITEPVEVPRRYLQAELGLRFDAALADMFLQQAPNMVTFFRTHTSLDFIDGNVIPDFHAEADGGATGGRSVCAAPYDGRKLGARIHDLKPPLDLTSPFGMGIAAGADVRHFINATSNWASFRHAALRLLRHGRDVARHGRGMQLVAGNALVARLLKSADDLGVRILLGTAVREVMTEGGRAKAVRVASGESANMPRVIEARRGIVLACGGFPHDTLRKSELFDHAPTGHEHHSAAPPSNIGDGLRLGEAAGGTVRRDLAAAGAWAPVSLVPNPDGTTGRFPHLIERGKPGLIAVMRNGQRFGNEANSYYDMMSALFARCKPGEPAEAWLVCDHSFLSRYGLGRVRPWPFPRRRWLRNGYLKRGRTIAELAAACGIDPVGFAATISAFNATARNGNDPAFGRGESAYNRIQGEADHGPNPCVAPLDRAPFYAVRIVPGSLGTFAGLKTDAHARVLGHDNQPVDGLYAVGNDMASMMGGHYPAGGITLGPALTFGYIAAHHASGIPLDNNRSGDGATLSAPSSEAQSKIQGDQP